MDISVLAFAMYMEMGRGNVGEALVAERLVGETMLNRLAFQNSKTIGGPLTIADIVLQASQYEPFLSAANQSALLSNNPTAAVLDRVRQLDGDNGIANFANSLYIAGNLLEGADRFLASNVYHFWSPKSMDTPGSDPKWAQGKGFAFPGVPANDLKFAAGLAFPTTGGSGACRGK